MGHKELQSVNQICLIKVAEEVFRFFVSGLTKNLLLQPVACFQPQHLLARVQTVASNADLQTLRTNFEEQVIIHEAQSPRSIEPCSLTPAVFGNKLVVSENVLTLICHLCGLRV